MTLANSKPQPLISATPRPLCPVCGQPSYSRTGVHPQCAMVQADTAITARRNARKATAPPPPPKTLRRFERICPACKAVQHVRRRTCECGRVL